MNLTENSRYPAILLISKIIRILAWCVVILTILGMIFAFFSIFKEGVQGFFALIGIGIIGGFLALAFFATAESMIVLIDIEYNTRSTSSEIQKNNISESTTGLSSEIKNRKAFTRVNTQGDKSEAKINSTEEAIEKLMAGGIEVQIIASDTSEKKYLINTGRSTRYIYKDDELMEYAKDFSLIKNQDEN